MDRFITQIPQTKFVTKALVLGLLISSIIIMGTTSSAFAAQMVSHINPQADSSSFQVKYLKTIFIENEAKSGNVYSMMSGKEWTVTGTADSSDPGVKNLINQLNQKISRDGTQAQITDLVVNYDYHLKGRPTAISIDYRIILDGQLSNYVITKDQTRSLVDLGWRGMTATQPVTIKDLEINMPISVIKQKEPELYSLLAGSPAETLMMEPLINAEFIKEQPMTNWHFLFDPTGINVDASTYGLASEISGFVVTKYTMGESSLREGRQVERVHEAEFTADTVYSVRTVQSADSAEIDALGFGALDSLEGVEIVGLTPRAPEGYGSTSTGNFPVTIIYGMAGLAAVGGGVFFMFSSRQMKKEQNQGQTGIDPKYLRAYSTSESSGAYQTTRGEAQLASEDAYAQTRSVYEELPSKPSSPAPVESEATCSCAHSVEMGSECDCAMQGSCFCDSTCNCNADVCREQVSSQR